MIGPPQVIAEATCSAELVSAFHARKEELSISNAALDHLLNQASGHSDKLWSGTRSLSADMLDKMLAGLGLRLLVASSPEGVSRMRHRWERRQEQAVRLPARISKELVRRARPYVLREAARHAASVRWRGISPELRSRLMRELARARWDARAVASEPVAQQKTADAP